MPVVVQPQSLGQIAGGTNTIWNNASAAARTDALLADIAAMRAGDPQGGYGALPPAIPASGAHYSAPGAYEGYMDYGFPPVMYQRSPYATAAYRTYRSPFGQLGVQPQIGFASAYPHVIQYPGDIPFREMPNLLSLAQALWSSLPMPPSMPMRGGMGVGGGTSRAGGNNSPTTKTAAAVGTRGRGDPYEPDNAAYPPLSQQAAAQKAAVPAYDYPWYYYKNLLPSGIFEDRNSAPPRPAPEEATLGLPPYLQQYYSSIPESPWLPEAERPSAADAEAAMRQDMAARYGVGFEPTPLPELAASHADSSLLGAVNATQEAIRQSIR